MKSERGKENDALLIIFLTIDTVVRLCEIKDKWIIHAAVLTLSFKWGEKCINVIKIK
jgi:hypothetical protein